MKTLLSFITLLCLSATLYSQAPQKLSYQAVIRNSNNELITSQQVGMRISLLLGSESGSTTYTETTTPTTNAFGLISIEIGAADPTGFSTIDWSAGTYFIKTETDPTGGTNYTITATSQLLSVPYALYAETSGSSTPGPAGADGKTIINGTTDPAAGIGADGDFYINTTTSTLFGPKTGGSWGAGTSLIGATGPTGPAGADGSGGFTNRLGDSKDGGIIFYLYIGTDGQEHGLVVHPDEGSGQWDNADFPSLVGANRTEDGNYNTSLMPVFSGGAKSYVTSLGANWYVPSIDEMNILWNARFHVNTSIRAGTGTLLSQDIYWSSTEWERDLGDGAISFDFRDGSFGEGESGHYSKSQELKVRAIRSF